MIILKKQPRVGRIQEKKSVILERTKAFVVQLGGLLLFLTGPGGCNTIHKAYQHHKKGGIKGEAKIN